MSSVELLQCHRWSQTAFQGRQFEIIINFAFVQRDEGKIVGNKKDVVPDTLFFHCVYQTGTDVVSCDFTSFSTVFQSYQDDD